MKIKLPVIKAFFLGCVAMLAFKWAALVFDLIFEQSTDPYADSIKIAFLVGVGLVIAITIVLIITD
jgi:hypothetical protein